MALRDLTITLRAEDAITQAAACPVCGQVDPEPSTHLARVHDGWASSPLTGFVPAWPLRDPADGTEA